METCDSAAEEAVPEADETNLPDGESPDGAAAVISSEKESDDEEINPSAKGKSFYCRYLIANLLTLLKNGRFILFGRI